MICSLRLVMETALSVKKFVLFFFFLTLFFVLLKREEGTL